MACLREELAELLGPEGAQSLSDARGGQRVRIPKRVPAGHWLEEAVGREAADAMAFRFGGCRLYVPRNPLALPSRDRIVELLERGWSVPRIARETGRSDRWVWRVKADHRAARPPMAFTWPSGNQGDNRVGT